MLIEIEKSSLTPGVGGGTFPAKGNELTGAQFVEFPEDSDNPTETTQLLIKTVVDNIDTKTGILTETPPSTDTASSGLNGRLQRIAQRLTSLIALLPAAFTSGGGVKTGLVDALPSGANLIGKFGFDQTTPGTTESVTVKPTGVGSSVTITRPSNTTAYPAGGVIGASTGSTAAQVLTNIGVAGKPFMLTDVTLMIEVGSIPSGMSSFTMEFYNITPPSALGDGAAWTLASGDWASYLGYISIGSPAVRGNCLYIQASNINKSFLLSSANLYFYLKTDTGFTPSASVVKLVSVNGTVM